MHGTACGMHELEINRHAHTPIFSWCMSVCLELGMQAKFLNTT